MRALLLAGLLLVTVFLPTPAVGGREASVERFFDEHGRLLAEVGVDAGGTGLGYTRVYHHPDAKARAGGAPAMTDCASTKYVAAGWRWSAPVSFVATAYAAEFGAALATWDAATGASIGGSVSAGSAGVAGVFDGVNQIGFADLGAGGTIAVTTTWYYRSTGSAVESDAQYNTRYPWSTTGASGAMDVQNIATHEIGHSLGLDHPRGGGSIGCLTMYAYGAYGETAKRTLGDGDILGVRALYG